MNIIKPRAQLNMSTSSYILVEKHKNNIPTDSADWLWTILLKKTFKIMTF